MTPRVFTITHPPETFLRSLVVPGESSRSGLSWGPSGLLWRTHAGPGTACALQIQAPDHNYRGELGNRLPSPKQPSATPDNLDDPSTPSTQNPEPYHTFAHLRTHTRTRSLSLTHTHTHTRIYRCPRLDPHLHVPQTGRSSEPPGNSSNGFLLPGLHMQTQRPGWNLGPAAC